MRPPPTTPPPKQEWRPNTRLAGAFPDVTYLDLFIDDVYQHLWVEQRKGEAHFSLHTWDGPLGEFASFAEAEDYVIASLVVKRFKQAYSGVFYGP